MDEVDGDAEATRRLGVEVATDLVAQLLEFGVPGVHIYAMNKSNSIIEIYDKLGIGPQGAPPGVKDPVAVGSPQRRRYAPAVDEPAPRTIEPAPPDAGGWIRRLSPFLAAHRRNVLLALGFSVAGMVVAGLTPVVEKVIVDGVIDGHDGPVVAVAHAPARRRRVRVRDRLRPALRRRAGGARRPVRPAQRRSSNACSGSTSAATTSCRPASSCRGRSSDVGLLQGMLSFAADHRRQRRAGRGVARASC